MNLKQFLNTCIRYYIPLMALMATVVLFCNFHGQGMSGLLHHYLDFKKIILSGFDVDRFPEATPTFPMWGYGWVFLLTESKIVILILQNILSIFSVWFCFRLIEENNYLPSGVMTLAKLLMVVAVPWYAFHSLLWPYSITNNLIILALVLFVKAISSEKKTTYPLLISGLLFGLALNFRSDYYLFPIGLIFVIGISVGFKIQFLQKSALWLGLIYLSLIPWGIYAKNATGHFLITSTNSGAVLFIGLGSLPGNKWGITPVDGDPKMQRAIESHFGEKRSYVSYEADQFLKTAFFKKVSEDPAHFAKKAAHNLRKTILGGTYQGEFYESPDCYPKCHMEYREKSDAIRSKLTHYFNLDIRSQLTIPTYIYSGTFSRFLTLFSYLAFPFTLIYAFKNRNILLIAFLCPIAYQTALNMAGNYLTTYTTNILFFLLINLCLGIFLLIQFFIPETQPPPNKCAE
jgi:hypothetical protein